MTRTNHNIVEATEKNLVASANFHFVTIKSLDDEENKASRRLARSHAVKHALRKKRKIQEDSGSNFRVFTLKDTRERTKVVTKRMRSGLSPSSLFSALDPFQTLAVDSSRLQALLGNYKARQAPEPVFSVAEELAFQNFNSVFRTSLVDPALLNAIMLSFAFAVTGGCINQECLGYQGQAIGHIRQTMNSVEKATSESTIGAILLLAGVEARLGMRTQVEIHLKAVQLLLEMCQSKGIYLTGGIKRAIFWQDLNSSILAGSDRIFGHTTFAEIRWTRNPFPPGFFKLPQGLASLSCILTPELIEVLEDIYALQCVRDIRGTAKRDAMLMANINNHIASIQSRLAGLSSPSPLVECCRIGAYVCSIMLCCTIWCALAMPPHLSTQLLNILKQSNDNPAWDAHSELLIWLLYVGGTFAPVGTVRSGYVALLRCNNITRFKHLCSSWSELHGILKRFIWSDRAFTSQAKAFWEEIYP